MYKRPWKILLIFQDVNIYRPGAAATAASASTVKSRCKISCTKERTFQCCRERERRYGKKPFDTLAVFFLTSQQSCVTFSFLVLLYTEEVKRKVRMMLV